MPSPEVPIILKPGGRLTVEVTGAGGEPVEAARAVLLDAAGEDVAGDAALLFHDSWSPPSPAGPPSLTRRDGALAFENLAPGTYRVKATKGAAAAREEPVEIVEGRPATVRLVLE